MSEVPNHQPKLLDRNQIFIPATATIHVLVNPDPDLQSPPARRIKKGQKEEEKQKKGEKMGRGKKLHPSMSVWQWSSHLSLSTRAVTELECELKAR